MRTPEQIEQDLIERYFEIEREAPSVAERDALHRRLSLCDSCRWRVSRDNDDSPPYVCSQPLVRGAETNQKVWPTVRPYYASVERRHPLPCGPEKALYQKQWPHGTRWMRNLLEWADAKFGAEYHDQMVEGLRKERMAATRAKQLEDRLAAQRAAQRALTDGRRRHGVTTTATGRTATKWVDTATTSNQMEGLNDGTGN